jgi:hypothetical protein
MGVSFFLDFIVVFNSEICTQQGELLWNFPLLKRPNKFDIFLDDDVVVESFSTLMQVVLQQKCV